MSRSTLIDTGLALNNGQVWVWGFRGSGQQGNGKTVVSTTTAPTRVQGLEKIVQVTGSAYSLVAINGDGEAWGWGQNLHGAAGVGTINIIQNKPLKLNVPPLAMVAAGEYFMVALTKDGRVYTWGHNLYGQLGNGGHTDSVAPVHVVLDNETAILVGASYEGAFAITIDSNTGNPKVWAWGRNASNSLGLGSDETVYRTPRRVTSLDPWASDIIYIDGGYRFGHAVLSGGSLLGWGRQSRLGIGSSSTNAIHPRLISLPASIVISNGLPALHARFISTVALLSDGRVYTWGDEGYNVGGRDITARPSANEVGGGKHHVYFRVGNVVHGAGYGAGNKFPSSPPSSANRDWRLDRPLLLPSN